MYSDVNAILVAHEGMLKKMMVEKGTNPYDPEYKAKQKQKQQSIAATSIQTKPGAVTVGADTPIPISPQIFDALFPGKR